MRPHPKPIIVLSKCLEFAACRYDGAKLRDDFIRALKPYVTFKTICPEVEIGLGIPRDPIRIVATSNAERLIQPSTGRDLTRRMSRFSAQFLRALSEVDGFILKAKSPSCGVRDTRRFNGIEGGTSGGKGSGMFAAEALRRFPLCAIEDETRLSNHTIRERFLMRLFTVARFRAVKESGSMERLVRFQSDNKCLLLTQSRKDVRVMGQIVANKRRFPIGTVMQEYESRLQVALAHTPRRTTHINTLQHGFGYVSKRLMASEKRMFDETLGEYKLGQIPLGAVTSLLRSWIIRYDIEYLEKQTYFEPFPLELLDVRDSGKARR